MRCLLLAASIVVATSVSSKFAALGISSNLHSRQSYEDFRRIHRHSALSHSEDTVGYSKRRTLFHDRLADIAHHNAQRRPWVKSVNKFTDYTEGELHALLGYKRSARMSRGQSFATSSLLELDARAVAKSEPKQVAVKVATSVDYRGSLTSSKFFRDQGSCGSCWAVAATGALEMQAEMHSGNATKLSYQQLVDCVQNPRHCGGTGGCQGATAELAFDYVQHSGLSSDDAYSASSSSTCPSSTPGSSLAVTSWQSLPTNQGEPLLLAVMQNGPAVVSVDGSAWFGYSSGVFDGCPKDAIVNHAVLAIGYGKDSGKSEHLYWLIRNSWGQAWGEGGHIRLLRHTSDTAHCGIDKDPKQGNGCDGGPVEIPVCGMCGILSDSSHPVGAIYH